MDSIPEYNGTTDRADSGWATTGVHNLNIFYDVSMTLCSSAPKSHAIE
jgi:hypothetical protein